MRVVEARECHPINAMGGLYVLVEGTRGEIYGEAANGLAIKTAMEHG